MEPKDIGKKIYTVVFMGRIQYEMFATFIFIKYIVTEYKSKDLRVIFFLVIVTQFHIFSCKGSHFIKHKIWSRSTVY